MPTYRCDTAFGIPRDGEDCHSAVFMMDQASWKACYFHEICNLDFRFSTGTWSELVQSHPIYQQTAEELDK